MSVPRDFGLMKPPSEGVTKVMHIYQAWAGSLRVHRIKGRAKKEQNAQKLQFLKVAVSGSTGICDFVIRLGENQSSAEGQV